MIGLIESLREDHRNIARLLDALDHQIDVFAGAARPDYDVICGIADYFLDYPDQLHHPKENAVFRRMHERAPDATAALGDLLRDHRTIHEHAVHFRHAVEVLLGDSDISRSSIVGAAKRFSEAQRQHMSTEEAYWFPAAEFLPGRQ